MPSPQCTLCNQLSTGCCFSWLPCILLPGPGCVGLGAVALGTDLAMRSSPGLINKAEPTVSTVVSRNPAQVSFLPCLAWESGIVTKEGNWLHRFPCSGLTSLTKVLFFSQQWWNVATGESSQTFYTNGTNLKKIHVSPDFRTYVTVDNLGILYILQVLE